MKTRGGPVAAIFCCAFVCASPAGAQGNGHAFGQAKKGGPTVTVPSAAGAPEIQASGTGVRNFGSWLDDASVLAPGQGFVSLGFGLWKMPGYREVDFPTVDAAVGVHRRVQVGASLPYFYANEPGGPVARGFGNTYLTAKLQLHDGSSHRVGVAVTPVLEWLTTAPVEGEGRHSWGLPLSVELQRTAWRAFGSVGYFSRGAIFASGALEVPVSSRTWITGAISQSHSMKADDLSHQLGLAKTRIDVTGSASAAITPRVLAYGSMGRTISRSDANSATLAVTGGVAVQLNRP